MLERIRKLWRFASYFILARKKIWRSPRHSDVLVFDASGQEVLLEYLHPWKPEVLHVGGEQINVWVLFASLFRRGRKFDAYVDCFIESVHPRLIVTFIHNSFHFYLIGKRHPDVKTLFIQNGLQTSQSNAINTLNERKVPREALRVDYMMTFGACCGGFYSKYLKGSVVPMGSLKNNLFPRSHAKTSGSIAFLSQYRNTKGIVLNGNYFSSRVIFEQADRLVLMFLVEYARKHGKEFFIVPCSGYLKDNTLEKEQEYYDELLAQDCKFSKWHWPGSSYDAVDSAEVVVGIDSTLAYESAARGNKTAIFSIRTRLLDLPDRAFGWPEAYPDEGPFWTNHADPAAFERILDHLFAIDEAQWQAELSECRFADLLAYDPGNTILQSVLRKELGAAPVARDKMQAAISAP